jgi:DNA-binding transcriptional ArsR family regulator
MGAAALAESCCAASATAQANDVLPTPPSPVKNKNRGGALSALDDGAVAVIQYSLPATMDSSVRGEAVRDGSGRSAAQEEPQRARDAPSCCHVLVIEFHQTGIMKSEKSVQALAALAQETRLAVFRLLVQAGSTGLTVGQIAGEVGVPNTTLSFHLKELVNAGLVTTRHQGRFIYCFANFDAMDSLVGFLVQNCCDGEPCAVSPRAKSCKPRKAAT